MNPAPANDPVAPLAPNSFSLSSPTEIAGTFYVKGLTVPDTTERNLALILNPDGTAALITEFVGRGTITERGRWTAENSKAEIVWTELDGETISLRMIFELRGNEMVYIGPDPNAFGMPGIRLNRATQNA